MTTAINLTLNGSLVDDDVFLDAFDEDLYYEDNFPTEIFEYFDLFLLNIEVLISALAIASDIYLIVIISKFKNLQNRINNFIRLYAIFNIFYMVLENLLGATLSVMGADSFLIYCFINNLDHLFITLSYYILTFVALDWYMLNYHPTIYGRYPKSFKYGACIIFVLAIPKWITTSTVCFINYYHHLEIRFHLEMASSVLCIIIMTCIALLKNGKVMSSEARKTEYAFIVPRTVLLLSVFYYIVELFLLFLPGFCMGYSTLTYVFINIGIDLILAAPIVILYQLIKLNKNFKSAYIKSCKRRRIRNYDDDNLDADSDNEAPLSNVTFDKNSGAINL